MALIPLILGGDIPSAVGAYEVSQGGVYGGGIGGVGAVIVVGGGGGGGSGGGSTGDLPPAIDTPPTSVPQSPVPEPDTWLMLIAGFALIGTVLRRRSSVARITSSSATGFTFGGGMPLHAKLGVAGNAAASETVGVAAVSTKAAAIGKLALCVCPPALMVGAIATIPPLQQAVHRATAPAGVARPMFAARATAVVPCDPLATSSVQSGATVPLARMRDLNPV